MYNLGKIFTAVKEGVSVSQNDAKLMAGIESIDPVLKPEVVSKVSNMGKGIESVFQQLSINAGNENFEIQPHQLESAKAAALVSLDPVKSLNAFANGRQEVTAGTEGRVIDTASYLDSVIPDDKITYGMEAFDKQDLSASVFFSIVFNSMVIVPDPVANLFFPVVVMDPKVSSATVTAKITNVITATKRDISGKPTDLKKESLIKKMNDVGFFTEDANKLTPVFRTESASNMLDVSGIKKVVEINGEKVTTSAIKTNTKVDLLGISQPRDLVAKGIMDESDAISSRISLDTLYFTLTGNDSDGNEVTEYFGKQIKGLPAVFTHTITGGSKEMQLDFKSDTIAWTGGKVNTVNNVKTAIADLASLTDGYEVNVRVALKGDAHAQNGDFVVYPVVVELASVIDAAGNVLDNTDDTYTAMAALFETIKLEGVVPEAHATNSNARFRGKMITSNTLTNVYPVPVRTKVHEITSIFGDGDDGDSAGLLSQIEFNKEALNKTALMELINAAVVLDSISDRTMDYGISNELVNKRFLKEDIVLGALVDSKDSSSREDDIIAALKLKLKNMALTLYTESNYNRAFAVSYPGSKPTVIIGVNTTIGRFISSFSDENFNYEVAVTPDAILLNKIVMSFGIMGGERHKQANPLNFGVTFWSPEPVIAFQRQESGTIKQESISMSRYLVQTLMPILAIAEVSGVDEVTGKITQYYKNVQQ